jgi:hypothetical protein
MPPPRFHLWAHKVMAQGYVERDRLLKAAVPPAQHPSEEDGDSVMLTLPQLRGVPCAHGPLPLFPTCCIATMT